MSFSRPALARLFLVAAMVAVSANASAQPIFDHLQCHKIKDPAPKVKYTANLTPQQNQFVAQTGCQVKVPAKLFCTDVEKSGVVPAPPLPINGQTTRNYLCYKLKCPKVQMPLAVEDQFGTRTITVKNTGYLCAPAREVGFPDPATPTPCLPQATPTCAPGPEVCNGMDDDCDMQIDEGLGQTTCGTGACQVMVQNCVMGMSQTCSPGTPTAETCNGVDDNCDGIVDNAACPVKQNAQGMCTGTFCQYACDPGYSDCNGNINTDGCEVFVNGSDNANCGACAAFCSGMCVSGQCKLPNGAACSTSGQCQSTNCVDGFCCNTACTSVCQACSLAKNSFANGTCANIPVGTDPDAECVGTQTCNGAGGCQP